MPKSDCSLKVHLREIECLMTFQTGRSGLRRGLGPKFCIFFLSLVAYAGDRAPAAQTGSSAERTNSLWVNSARVKSAPPTEKFDASALQFPGGRMNEKRHRDTNPVFFLVSFSFFVTRSRASWVTQDERREKENYFRETVKKSRE